MSQIFSAITGIVGGLAGMDAASNVGDNLQAQNTANQQVWNNYFNQAQQNLQPYSSLGTQMIPQYQNFMNQQVQNYGTGNQQFKFDTTTDPEYQMMLNAGLAGVASQSNARGGTNSGAVQSAMNTYAHNQANQAYQSQFNNWLNSQRLNQQQSALMGNLLSQGVNLGYGATGQQNNALFNQTQGLANTANTLYGGLNQQQQMEQGLYGNMLGSLGGAAQGIYNSYGSGSGGTDSVANAMGGNSFGAS